MSFDPFGSLVGAGASLLSSLFAKKPPKQQPLQNFQSMIPQYQQPGAYVNPTAANLYDVGQSSLYQQGLGDINRINAGGSALPDAYRQAVLGQAQQNYGLINDRLKRSNMDQANLHGLLGSGSLMEQNARQDESYLREMGNVTSNLTQQDLAERARMQAMMQAMEGQRAQTSGSAYSLGLQGANQQNQYNLGSAQNANSYAMQGVQTAGSLQQNQYNSDLNRWQAGQQQQASAIGGLGDMYSLYRQFTPQQSGLNQQGQLTRGGGVWGNAQQGWRVAQTAAGRAYNRVGFAGNS